MNDAHEGPQLKKINVGVTHVDPFDYEPPEVTYDPITEDITKTRPTGEQYTEEIVVGYAANPPADKTAPNLEQLRYYAALIECRTHLKIRVAAETVKASDGDGSGHTHDEEQYAVRTDRVVSGAAPYEVAFAWLSGFENGVHAILWSNKKRP